MSDSKNNLDIDSVDRGQMYLIEALVHQAKEHHQLRIENPELDEVIMQKDGTVLIYSPETIQQVFADPTAVDHRESNAQLGELVSGLEDDGSVPVDGVMGKHRKRYVDGNVTPDEEHLLLKSHIIGFIAQSQSGMADKSARLLQKYSENNIKVDEDGDEVIELSYESVLEMTINLMLEDMFPSHDWNDPTAEITRGFVLQRLTQNMQIVGTAFYKLSLAGGDPEKINAIKNDPILKENQRANRAMIEALLNEEHAKPDADKVGLAKRLHHGGFKIGTITTSLLSTLTASCEPITGALLGGFQVIAENNEGEDRVWRILENSRIISLEKDNPKLFDKNLDNLGYIAAAKENPIPILRQELMKDVMLRNGTILKAGTKVDILTEFGMQTLNHPLFAGKGEITRDFYDPEDGNFLGREIILDTKDKHVMRAAWAMMKGEMTSYNEDPVSIQCPGFYASKAAMRGFMKYLIDNFQFKKSNGKTVTAMSSTKQQPLVKIVFKKRDQPL